MNKRDFANNLPAVALTPIFLTKSFVRNPNAKLKTLIFWEADFPTVDGIKLTKNFLADSLKNHDVIFVADELQNKLTEKDLDLFINPSGSIFQKRIAQQS